MPTNQEARQASVRAVTGTAYFYNDDWMVLFVLAGITSGTFNDRMLAWINSSLGTSYININDAMKAYAVSQGASSWNELGTFTPGGITPYFLLLANGIDHLLLADGASKLQLAS